MSGMKKHENEYKQFIKKIENKKRQIEKFNKKYNVTKLKRNLEENRKVLENYHVLARKWFLTMKLDDSDKRVTKKREFKPSKSKLGPKPKPKPKLKPKPKKIKSKQLSVLFNNLNLSN
tara:strand:- start:165 stop:518 length:354 start_codon:yes stop_codon:yes gene_type:complete